MTRYSMYSGERLSPVRPFEARHDVKMREDSNAVAVVRDRGNGVSVSGGGGGGPRRAQLTSRRNKKANGAMRDSSNNNGHGRKGDTQKLIGEPVTHCTIHYNTEGI